MPTTVPKAARKDFVKVSFAEEYRDLQFRVTELSGAPLPPCYFCDSNQLWNCFQSGYECANFKRYCQPKD